MSIDFGSNITINIALGAAPLSARGFGRVGHIVTDQAFGSTSRGLLVGSAAEVEAALTAGDITAAARSAGLVAFSQIPRPVEFLYIDRDSGAPDNETHVDALNSAVA